jgi:5-methylcytosine-specific restriction endonuclease McrA
MEVERDVLGREAPEQESDAFGRLEAAVAQLEKANAGLDPQLLGVSDARKVLERYVTAQRLASFGVACLAARIDDAAVLAKTAGVSVAKAKDTLVTGKVAASSAPLGDALRTATVSLEQACEIAKAEDAAPGCATDLIGVARDSSFAVLREKARNTKLEAEATGDLFVRQHHARSARNLTDELGMIDIHLRLQPHVGVPVITRAEAHAQRLARAVDPDQREPFEAYLADAYAEMLSGDSVKARSKRPELVVLVSHAVAQRGWSDVGDDEVCKIPGVGPISPKTAKQIATDAFINAVICDGKDLRNFKRFTKHIPVEVQIALELGDPPDFDGVRCVDCGNRFRTEFDHVEPRAANGPTSKPNLNPRCWPCHLAKTKRDRAAGKLTPPAPARMDVPTNKSTRRGATSGSQRANRKFAEPRLE